MSEKPVIDHKAGTAFLPQIKAVVTFRSPVKAGTGSSTGSSDDGAKQVNPSPKPTLNTGEWAYWGETNNLPQVKIDAVEKCGVAGAALEYNVTGVYGAGIEVGEFVFENGEKKFQQVDLTKYPEVQDFFEACDIQDDYLIDAATDLIWFFNFFPYFILNKGKSKINKLFLNEAAYSRFSVRDSKTNRIEKIGVCTDWQNPTDIIEIPLLSDYDTVADLRSRKSGGYRFAVAGYYPTPGKSYYQQPYWDSVRVNGYMEIASEVPKYMKSIFKHAMHLKYHIHIPDTHFKTKFKDWESKTEEQRLSLIDSEMTEMQEMLTGLDNVQKAFFSFYSVDQLTGKEIPGWKIEPIQDYMKEGKYLPESGAANSEILFAFRTHPDLIGAGIPGGGGISSRGNSGSNTREADLIKKASLASYRRRIVKPIYHVKRFNNWSKNLEFRIQDTVLTTLDNGSQGIKKAIDE